jgi:hypothetical protein
MTPISLAAAEVGLVGQPIKDALRNNILAKVCSVAL